MSTQQLTLNTHTVNAIIHIKRAIERLSKDVSNEFEYHEAQYLYSDTVDCIRCALASVNKITVDLGVIALLERSIETLSIKFSEQVTKEQIEDTNDDAIGFLSAALGRLGYDRYAS